MKTFKILIVCLITTFGYAQKKAIKTSQSITVNKDAVVDLNTSYVEIEVDTWNKDVVEIEAYIEGEKLSEGELKDALKSWNLKVDATSDRVSISSEGGMSSGNFSSTNYDGILKNLEFALADLPDLPEIGDFPIVLNLKDFTEFPEMPKMPEFPKLPELPEGVNQIQFDYDKYQEEGESYLSEWSKQYEKQGGKELQKRMEDWAKKFVESDYQQKMTKWGEDFGQQFEGKWAKDIEEWAENFGNSYGKDMEIWAERFGNNIGKDMEKWGEEFGNEWAQKMEAWGERFAKQMEDKTEFVHNDPGKIQRKAELQKRLEQRKKALDERRNERIEALEKRRNELEERRSQLDNRKSEYQKRKETREDLNGQSMSDYLKKHMNQAESFLNNDSENENNSKVRKVIKLKIPKKAKLKLNVRHGELKVASLIQNIQGDVSHTFLVAEHIAGKDTSINVSYSPVIINTWDLGTLNLNFVDKAQIKNAKNLVLNSKSSNISIGNLTDTGIIDGSFGDLTISNLAETFRTLNLVLENSDALINLPSNLDYNLYFNGNRSKYNNKLTDQKTIRKDDNGQDANRNIMVNAKFSNVIIN